MMFCVSMCCFLWEYCKQENFCNDISYKNNVYPGSQFGFLISRTLDSEDVKQGCEPDLLFMLWRSNNFLMENNDHEINKICKSLDQLCLLLLHTNLIIAATLWRYDQQENSEINKKKLKVPVTLLENLPA